MNDRRGAVRPEVKVERGANASLVLTNALPLVRADVTMPEKLAHWAAVAPGRIFLSEAAVEGGRRSITFAQAEERRRALAGRLLTLPVSVERPLMIMATNSIHHALLMLAATSVGIPVAIVSPAYAQSRAAPWAKLAKVMEQIGPGLIVADDVAAAREALVATGFGDLCVLPVATLDWIDALAPADAEMVDAAEAGVGPDSTAKLLLTSGSTGTPKAVINTQAMMVSNMEGLSQLWPFLLDRPPVLVDWLPWNHTFGGNCCFNITLYFGGTMHIDDGRPTTGMFERSAALIRALVPTAYFNVPVGYEMLLGVLEADGDFARAFLEPLDFLFNAGAALPPSIRRRLEAVAEESLGRPVPIFGGWGSTETAPFSTVLYFPTTHAANLGVPLPGTEIRMIPDSGRMELRVRGPNVMPGYWRDGDATANAFDADGFYRIGDAGKLANPADPSEGILFDGRVSENFKLTSGTWVNVGALRLATVSALAPLISDAVIAGEGRDELGVLLFANEDRCSALLTDLGQNSQDGLAGQHSLIRDHLSALLKAYNAAQMGSSTRIMRFLVLTEPPSGNDGEITEKGYLNQRALLTRRFADVERLFGADGRF